MINFPFGTNGNSIILGVPILKHITEHVLRVYFSLPLSALQIMESIPNTVELQWLEHLWDHENEFETGVVRANEG